MKIKIKKRNGKLTDLDITKIQKQTKKATKNLKGVNQSELEIDAQIKFVNGMTSEEIQDSLIKTAIEKIDIDVPNWTFVGARLFLYDLYHRVGKTINGTKGKPYSHLKKYINHGIKEKKIIHNLMDGYDLEDLNNEIKPERDLQFNYLGIKTMYDRYILKDNNNNPIELPQHMFMGIAMFLARNEKNKQERAKEFYNVISKFEVMLATPTLSNARTIRHQLSSCYLGSTPDNIEGIFDSYKEMGLLSKFGGGIGWDWNQIRSLGSVIDKRKGLSGGTVPFLKITNDIALAVDQMGTRKGAIAVYLEPWHQDIFAFLDLKKNSGEERLRAHDLFPALWLNDLFMERIINNEEWTLFDPYEVKDLHSLYGDEFKSRYEYYESIKSKLNTNTINAKDLWKKILTSYFESGSPFLTYKDRANESNPNSHVGTINSSNLCTEIFQNTKPNQYLINIEFKDGEVLKIKEEEEIILDDGRKVLGKYITALDKINNKDILIITKEKEDGETAVCNLASINLSKINKKEDIERVVPIAVRMLDNVIELNFHPVRKTKVTNELSRGIGLGIMGEAQMIAESGMIYGTKEHMKKIHTIMEYINFYTIKSSSLLSKERGSYPNFKNSKWEKGIFPMDLIKPELKDMLKEYGIENKIDKKDWDKLKEDVKKVGVRNGYMMAIAPTSTISILVGTTQSTEPVYKRKWFEENLSGLIPVVAPNLNSETWAGYNPAFEVEQLDLIRVASIRQKWIDQGQSTNVFMRLDKASGKYLNDIYILGYKLGLKSNYYLRGESPEANNDVADRSQECVGCQ